VQTPDPFDLVLTVESHGWYDLPPWRWDRAQRRLGRPLWLSSGRAVFAEVGQAERGLGFRAVAEGRLSAAEAREARDAMAACLALDEDLAPFRARVEALEAVRASGKGKDLPDLRWAIARGAGRLLRSPTVFEDAVKTLCTTNCTWAVTRGMVGRLCAELGAAAPLESRTFPTPAAMASRDARFYREVIRTGYRAPFFVALARGVAEGRIDLERLRAPGVPPAEDVEAVAREIRALDGFGPYATEHLLRLLGRHGHLALDSWNRKKLAQLRGKRRPPSDRTLRRWYARYGEWAGLAMWLEVTAEWHAGELPGWP
jgi:N-glycosylase/DNA lyase